MNQVNYPEKMVWAHLKLDTNDKEEILPYLKRDTINEGSDEHITEHNSESQDDKISPLAYSANSIFESYRNNRGSQRHAKPLDPTTFCHKLDSIGEFDPYGASLVSLLSKIRPLTRR
jgi:hypothetical protein